MAVLVLDEYTDEILVSLKDKIEEAERFISQNLDSRELGTIGIPHIYVYPRDVQMDFPAIDLRPQPKVVTPFASGCQQHRYTVNIDCTVRHPKPKIATEYVNVIGMCVQNWLNRPSNKRFQLGTSGIFLFNSEARSVQLGFRREGAIRTARVLWVGDLLKTFTLFQEGDIYIWK